MLINMTPYSCTKKLPYEIVYGRKLNLLIYMALKPLQSIHIPIVGDCVGATSNMVRTMIEAAIPGREGQSMHELCEKVFRYPCQHLHAPLYKASAAEG